jgi:hypothetical protein
MQSADWLEVNVQWHGERKRQPLLRNGTINSATTIEHVRPRDVTNGNRAVNGVFYAVRADSCHEINCGKRRSLWVRAEAVSGELEHRSRSAHGFQTSVHIWLYNKIIQVKSRSHIIMKMQMLATLDTANSDTGNIRDLNLAAVKHTTVQVTRLPL